jgi:hypothetical protein
MEHWFWARASSCVQRGSSSRSPGTSLGMESSFVTSVDVAWSQSSLFLGKPGIGTTQDASSQVGLIGVVPPLLALRQTSSCNDRRG